MAKLPSCEDCTETKGLFEEVINYTETLDFDHTTEIDGPAQYNGNISNVKYKVKWRKGQAEYGFAYDELDRLMHGRYREVKDPGTYVDNYYWYINKKMYDVDFAYSDNGNITNIQRNGYRRGIWPNQEKYPEPIDVLDLIYTENQLISSKDNATGGKHRGFNDPGGYAYQDGKLISEDGKGIDKILYNFLDKPYRIAKSDGSSINIIYDASGRELQREVISVLLGTEGSTVPSIIFDYAGGIEYIDQTLLNVPHPEGRYYVEEGTHLWEYILSDHLGNGRVYFTDRNNDGKISTKAEDREINQEIHYYPYGMRMDGDFRSSYTEPDNQYQYNGIDFVDDLDLDVNMAYYRTLDPATGNW